MIRFPTIGRADIDVHYDGKGLPEEARALGEETGGEAGDAHAEEFDKRAKEGFDETGRDLEKRSGESGERSGKNFGVKYGDSVDKTLKQRLQKTSDEVAKVFSDDDGVKKFTENYKGAGTATDVLREKLRELHDSNVIEGKDYDRNIQLLDTYSKKTDAHARQVELVNDRVATAAKHNKDFADTQDEVNRRIKTFIDQSSDEAIGRIDRMADGFDEVHKKSDLLGGDGEKLKRVADGIDAVGDSSNRAAPRVATGRKSFDDLAKTFDDVVAKGGRSAELDKLGASIDRTGDYIQSGGTKTGRGSQGFRDISKALDDVKRAGGVAGRDIDDIGAAIETFGGRAAKGGDGAGKGSTGISTLSRALGSFDPSDNMGQLFALIIALAPDIATLGAAAGAGLTILAGGAAALALAVGGGFAGFSNLFGDLKKVQPEVRPAAEALQAFAGKDGLGLLRDALQKPMFEGLAGEFTDLRTKTIPSLEPAFATLGGAINKVLKGWTTDLQSSGFKKDFDDLITSLNPSVVGLGKLFSNLVGIVQQVLKDVAPYTKDFIDKVGDATGDFLKFLKTDTGKNAVKQFFDDLTPVIKAVGDAFVTIGGKLGKLVTPENIGATIAHIKDLADAIGSLVGAGGKLGPAITGVTGGIRTISDAFDKAADVIDPMVTGIELGAYHIGALMDGLTSSIRHSIELIGTIFGGLGKAASQAANGDFAGAMKTLSTTSENARGDVARSFAGIGTAIGIPGAKFDELDTKSQASLGTLSRKLGVTGEDAKSFGGIVAESAKLSGVKLDDLGNVTSPKQLADKLGISGDAANALYGSIKTASGKSTIELDGLRASANTSLDKIDASLGATGKANDVLKDAFVKQAGGSKTAMEGLANAKSYGDIQDALGLTGSASKTKMADRIIESARASGESIDDLPPKIQALVTKYGTIPAKKNTDVTIAGEGAAIGAIGRIKAEIDSLHDRTVSVAVHYEATGKQLATGGAQFGATGGIMAGGRMTKGGKWGSIADYAFANGGILNRATLFGNVVAGEAGAEAIVPLTGPLSAVDKSVRELSAIARGGVGAAGYGNAPSRSITLTDGAVRVYSNVVDGRQVASSVMDRLDAVVGSF